MRSTAITPIQFTRLMKACSASPVLAVALSGGADSMALTLLAHQWAKAQGGKIIALTVDHGLRKASAAEAKQVARWMKARGIRHHILRIKTKIPKANRQAMARDARYALLTEWCRTHDVKDLLLAHQQDDQAETFLMRLHRGSGIDGLSCMAMVSERSGVRLVRPLLGVTKAQLVATLQAMKQKWIDDPSNHNDDYTRTRIRTLMPALSKAGIRPDMLADMAHGFAKLRHVFEEETMHAWKHHVHLDPLGYATLNLRGFKTLDEETALRLLAELHGVIGGHSYRPRFESLTALHEVLKKKSFTSRTLGGCIFLRSKKKKEPHLLYVLHEPKHAMAPAKIAPGETQHWDERFQITLAGTSPPLTLRALGENGFRQAASQHPELKKTTLPKQAYFTLPSLWSLETLVAAPHIGYRHPAFNGAVSAGFFPVKSLAGGQVCWSNSAPLSTHRKRSLA